MLLKFWNSQTIRKIRGFSFSPIGSAVIAIATVVPLYEFMRDNLFPDNIEKVISRGYSLDEHGLHDAMQVGDFETAGLICSHQPFQKSFGNYGYFGGPYYSSVKESVYAKNRAFMRNCDAFSIVKSCNSLMSKLERVYEGDYNAEIFKQDCGVDAVWEVQARLKVESFVTAAAFCALWQQQGFGSESYARSFLSRLEAPDEARLFGPTRTKDYAAFWHEFGSTDSLDSFCSTPLRFSFPD